MADLAAFWIGRNPAAGSRLPYLLRLPLAGEGRVFLAARETWPRSGDVFCYQVGEWPAEADIIEEVPVEGCWRQGAAVHLVLRRRTNRRSLFVWTKKAGRTLVFWRSAASMQRARPGIRVPLARSFGGPIAIAVDSGERYPWRFRRSGARIERRRLPVGDYAVMRDDVVLAAVERKTPQDLAGAAVGGALGLVLADLERAAHAAVVVEGRLSDVVKAAERGRVRSGWLLDVIAALQAAHPRVQWMFAETRAFAEDWAYRWLAACERAESEPYAMPLLDERAFAEPSFVPDEPGPRALDTAARRALLLREAASGTVWTSRAAAERCAVSRPTALADLNALVAARELTAEGAGRARTYRAARAP